MIITVQDLILKLQSLDAELQEMRGDNYNPPLIFADTQHRRYHVVGVHATSEHDISISLEFSD